LIFGPLAKLFETIFELIIPTITAKIIDYDLKNTRTDLYLDIGYIAILTVFGLIAALICQYFSAKAAYGFGENLRNDLFKRVNHFSFDDIDKFGSSTLVTRLTVDIISITNGLNYVLRLISRTPFLIIGSIIACSLIDTNLTFIFVISTFLLCITVFFITKWAISIYRQLQSKLDGLTTLVRENVTGTRIVRTFDKQSNENKKFKKYSENYANSVINVIKYDTLITPLAFFILNLGTIFILKIGVGDINTGNLTQGELSAMLNYLTLILLVILQIVNLMPILTLALASRKRLLDLLEIADLETIVGISAIEDSKEIFTLKNVSKRFDKNSEPIFENIHLSVNKGDCLGIIGGIGSGKSTLAKLFLREYSFDGEINFFGKPIKSFSKKFLREYIGYVSQKSVIFNGSVFENFSISKTNVTLSEITKALTISQFSDLDISGNVSQNSLSGGQKQRLSIARVLVRNPKLLILDDSTSALDFETEEKLMSALKKNFDTIILITQRESSLKFCNKILRL
jgi:ATP-binding cassette subfamily B protein